MRHLAQNNGNNRNTPYRGEANADARRAAYSAPAGQRPAGAAPRFVQNGPRGSQPQNAVRTPNGENGAGGQYYANGLKVRPANAGGSLVPKKTGAVTAKKSFREKSEERMDKREEKAIVQNRERRHEEARRNAGVVRTKSSVDRPFLILVLVLVTLGSIAVFSASYPDAINSKNFGPLHYIWHQIIFVAIGSIGMLICAAIPYRFYKTFAPLLFVAALAAVAAVIPFGVELNGAKRWIPVAGFTLQPSEAMKPALVIMLAWFYNKYRDKITDRVHLFKNTFVFGVLIPGIILAASVVLIIIEKHLSATLILGLIGVTVMIIGGSHIGMTALCAGSAGSAVFTYYIFHNEYALERLLNKFSDNADKLKGNWQTDQGVLAIGSGGLLGLGIGSGRLKYSYVAEAFNDFIFTIWCEETGFVGAVLVIALFVALIWRGFRIAMHAPDTFSALTVYGLTAHVGIQVFLNLLVVTNIFPTTGVQLPFFSHGGSSLICLMAEMGIILSISKHSYQNQ